MIDRVPAPLQAAAGAVMVAAPWWIELLHQITALGGAITALCGALLGIQGVYRIFRPKTDRRYDDQ